MTSTVFWKYAPGVSTRTAQSTSVKLRTARYLKARADASGVTVGYSGVAARIARVHQFGERDQVAPGIFTDYPVRELLGISQADERLIYNTVLGRIAEAVR